MRDKFIITFELICEYCLYGLIFFLPISKSACEIFFWIALLSFICEKILKPDFKFLKDNSYFFLLLFICFNALSLLHSGPLLAKSLGTLFGKWLKFALVFVVAANILSNERRIARFVTISVFSGILVCLDGIFQRMFKFDFFWHNGIIAINGCGEGIGGITAVFDHYNDLGGYLVMLFFIYTGLFLTMKSKNALYRILMFLPIPLFFSCLSLTFSRGALVSLIFALLIMVVILYRAKKIATSFIILSIAFIAMLPLKERLLYMLERGGDSVRFIVWKGTWLMIKENMFLGKGVGTYMDHFLEFIPGLSARYAHNCYLQIWAETGIFALLSFSLFIGLVLKKGLLLISMHKDYLSLGLFCGITGFLVHSFFDTNFYSLQLSYLFWINLGVLHALAKMVRWSEYNNY